MNSYSAKVLDVFGLEAIKVQGNKTFVELSLIFQRALDHKANLDYSKKDPKVSDAKFRELEMYAYCRKTLESELRTFFKKKFNLQIGTITFTDLFNSKTRLSNVSYFYGMLLEISAKNKKGEVSTKDTQNLKLDKIKFSELIDLNSNKFKTQNWKGEDGSNHLELRFNLWFDQVSAFTVEDHTQAGFESVILTAEELSAIILHEVGHAADVCENTEELFFRIERVSKHLENLSSSSSADDLSTDVVPKTKELLSSTLEMMDSPPKSLENMETVLEYIESSKLNTLPWVALYVIRMILITITMLIISIMSSVLIGIILPITTTGKPSNKTSDTMPGPKNFTRSEFVADEFVSRCGGGGHLASGLRKVFKGAELVHLAPSHQALRNSQFTTTVMKIYLSTIGTFTNAMIPPSYIYGADVDRIRKIFRNNMTIFKNDLPKEVLDWYIQDTEKIMKTLESFVADSTTTSRVLTKFFDLFPLTSLSAFMNRITNGNIVKEVDDLYNDLEKIANTKLNYHGVKFKAMADAKSGSEALASLGIEDTWQALNEYVESNKL